MPALKFLVSLILALLAFIAISVLPILNECSLPLTIAVILFCSAALYQKLDEIQTLLHELRDREEAGAPRAPSPRPLCHSVHSEESVPAKDSSSLRSSE